MRRNKSLPARRAGDLQEPPHPPTELQNQNPKNPQKIVQEQVEQGVRRLQEAKVRSPRSGGGLVSVCVIHVENLAT